MRPTDSVAGEQAAAALYDNPGAENRSEWANIAAKYLIAAATDPSVPPEQSAGLVQADDAQVQAAPNPQNGGMAEPRAEFGSTGEFDLRQVLEQIYTRAAELLRSPEAKNLVYTDWAGKESFTRFIMTRGMTAEDGDELSIAIAVNKGRTLGFGLAHALRGEAANGQEVIINYFHEGGKRFLGRGRDRGQAYVGSMILGDRYTPLASRGYENFNTIHIRSTADAGSRDSITQRWKMGLGPLAVAESLIIPGRGHGHSSNLEITSDDYLGFLAAIHNGTIDKRMMRKVIRIETLPIFKGEIDPDQSIEAMIRRLE